MHRRSRFFQILFSKIGHRDFRLLAILLVSKKFLCLSGGDLLHGIRLLRHFTFSMTLTPKKHHLSHMSHVCVALVFSARQTVLLLLLLLLLHPAWRVIKTRSGPTPKRRGNAKQSTVKEYM